MTTDHLSRPSVTPEPGAAVPAPGGGSVPPRPSVMAAGTVPGAGTAPGVSPALGAVPGAVPVTGHEVTCPECGTVSLTSPGGRLASDFCPTCDFPLFWARRSPDVVAGADWSPDALRRAPGVAGTLSVATIACPVCRELNLPEARVCARCGADMRPVVVAPAAAPAPQPVVVVREEVVCGHRPRWLVVTVTAVLSIAATIGALEAAALIWHWQV